MQNFKNTPFWLGFAIQKNEYPKFTIFSKIKNLYLYYLTLLVMEILKIITLKMPIFRHVE